MWKIMLNFDYNSLELRNNSVQIQNDDVNSMLEKILSAKYVPQRKIKLSSLKCFRISELTSLVLHLRSAYNSTSNLDVFVTNLLIRFRKIVS